MGGLKDHQASRALQQVSAYDAVLAPDRQHESAGIKNRRPEAGPSFGAPQVHDWSGSWEFRVFRG
jgi:hypothetical protein